MVGLDRPRMDRKLERYGDLLYQLHVNVNANVNVNVRQI